MIRLPKGVTVHIGGRKWSGEIPEDVCPPKLLPSTKTESKKQSEKKK